MAVVWPKVEPEPVYQGKKLSAWVGMEMPETRTGERDQAVRQIGTNALPYLLRWISYEPSPARGRVFIRLQKCLPQWIVRRAFFHKLWQGPRGRRQLQAGACFAILGEEASPAVPELLQLAIQRTSWNTREQARRVLMSMCKSAIPALIARLEDPSRPGRQMAIEFIGGCAARFQTHDDGAPFVPSLVKLMREEDAVLVLEAARTLGKLNLEAGLAVPALAGGLEHADPQVRGASAEALELFGREAQSAVPALQRTLDDSDPLVRRTATNALQQIARDQF
jgi:HEAT repeat protein